MRIVIARRHSILEQEQLQGALRAAATQHSYSGIPGRPAATAVTTRMDGAAPTEAGAAATAAEAPAAASGAAAAPSAAAVRLAQGEAPVKAEYLRAASERVHVGAVGGRLGEQVAGGGGEGQHAKVAAAGEGESQAEVRGKSKKQAKKVRRRSRSSRSGCRGAWRSSGHFARKASGRLMRPGCSYWMQLLPAE